MNNLSHLAAKWPSSIVSRRKVSDFSGGILSEKYLANLDSLGEGPPRIKIGRQVAYPVSTLITWLENRVEESIPADRVKKGTGKSISKTGEAIVKNNNPLESGETGEVKL